MADTGTPGATAQDTGSVPASGSGQAANPAPTPPANGNGNPAPTVPLASEGSPPANQGNATDPKVKTYTQHQIAAIMRRERAAAVQEAQEAAAAQRAEAERQAAEKAGQFEQLYQGEKAQRANLETDLKNARAELARIRETIEGALSDRIKDWPPEILELDPATLDPNGYTVTARQAWVERMAPIVSRLAPPAPAPGNGPAPKPVNEISGPNAATSPLDEEAQRQAYINRKRATGFNV